MKKISIRKIVETSILVALATVIDLLFELIPFLNMPEGGHVSVAMLAIIINGFRNGWKYGLAGGLLFAILNWLIDSRFLHIGSIFFDYIFAFTVLGVSGFFQKQGKSLWKFCLIVFLLCLGRYIFTSLSGVLFFKEYAYIPEGLNWQLEGEALYWVYSFVIYNLPYLGLSTILCIVVGGILHNRGIIYKGIDL
jgi:thiamine transporter